METAQIDFTIRTTIAQQPNTRRHYGKPKVLALLTISCLMQTALNSSTISNSTAHAEDNFRPYAAAFSALPASAEAPTNPLTPEKISLGKKLFFEKKLSKDQSLSCNSCHGLATYGVDNQPTSPGHLGKRGDRNSPTVYNAALHFAQFWDGRAKDVEEQALGPIQNPIEMAMAPGGEEVLERLKADAMYTKLFKQAFPGEAQPLTFDNIGKAIGAFERTLLTPSRFDEYLKGNDHALSPDEKEGLKVFVQSGCTACHNGVTVGGQMYQKLGLVKPYATKDLGRFQVTKNESDRQVFKVPSLRNIEKTAPYFHDGSVATLDEAVSLMAEHQLGRTLSGDDRAKIIVFLKSLTGEIPASATVP